MPKPAVQTHLIVAGLAIPVAARPKAGHREGNVASGTGDSGAESCRVCAPPATAAAVLRQSLSPAVRKLRTRMTHLNKEAARGQTCHVQFRSRNR